MNAKKIVTYMIAILLLLGSCHQKKETVERIDIRYRNSKESLFGPSWEEVVTGKHPEFLTESSITNKSAYDSLLLLIKKLEPMRKEIIPENFYPYLYCVIHYADSQTSVFILGNEYCILNGDTMNNNKLLTTILFRYSGYNNASVKLSLP